MQKKNSASSGSAKTRGRAAAPTLEAALAAAYRCLARRDHASQELARKLARKGFPPERIREVLERLSEQGYVDDGRFARQWVASRPHGPLRIREELRRKGIPEELIQEALERRSEEDILEQAFRLAQGKWERLNRTKRPFHARRRALSDFLLRRGFSHETVSRVLRRMDSAGAGLPDA